MRPYRWPCPTHMPPRCTTKTATDIPPHREATGGRTAEGRMRPSTYDDAFPFHGGRPALLSVLAATFVLPTGVPSNAPTS